MTLLMLRGTELLPRTTECQLKYQQALLAHGE